MRLQLRTVIYGNAGSGDPTSGIGGEECDHICDIMGFTDSLELHVECKIATCFRLGEIGHIGFNYSRRYGVHTDAAWAQQRGPVFHQGFQGILGYGIGGYRRRTCLPGTARGNASG